jgi:hypothetical protein
VQAESAESSYGEGHKHEGDKKSAVGPHEQSLAHSVARGIPHRRGR